MKSHDWLDRLRNVGFPFIPLESTQSHSPGQQAAMTLSDLEGHLLFETFLTPIPKKYSTINYMLESKSVRGL